MYDGVIKPVSDLYHYKAIVVSVYDGDTIRCDIDLGFSVWLKKQTIRLYGIDTPEIRGEERPDGLVAKDFVKSKLPAGSTILIETFQDKKGKYGRWLANIYYGTSQEEPVCLNEELVNEGYAERVVY